MGRDRNRISRRRYHYIPLIDVNRRGKNTDDERKVGRQTMTLSPHKTATEFRGEDIPATHELVYLVKRPSYEFCLAMPKSRATFESNGGTLFQVRFTGQSQLHTLVLKMGEIEDFFDGLSRLIDFIHVELAKRQEQVRWGYESVGVL